MNAFAHQRANRLIRNTVLAGAILGLATSSGCQLLPHAMQPHQLWKMNRGRQLGMDTYDFSVPPVGLEPENIDPHRDTDH